MSDIIAIVTPDQSLSVAVSEGVITLAASNATNPAVVESVSSIADVDVTTNGMLNGSILVYRTTTNKWTASTTLDAQDLEGGAY